MWGLWISDLSPLNEFECPRGECYSRDCSCKLLLLLLMGFCVGVERIVRRMWCLRWLCVG